MPEKRRSAAEQLSKYDAMPTEELEKLLRTDAETPEDGDTEQLLYIAQLLAVRRTEAAGEKKTAREAWEVFLRDYLPAEEDGPAVAETPKRIRRSWLCRTAVAAVAALLLIGGGITAAALPSVPWGNIAGWARETFYFVHPEVPGEETAGPDVSGPAADLQKALASYAADADKLPAWIPEEFFLEDVFVMDTLEQDTVAALYRNGEKKLRITVRCFPNNALTLRERSEEILEVCQGQSLEYYIFSNDDRICAAWCDGTYEYGIAGEVSLEILKEMIHSVENGG